MSKTPLYEAIKFLFDNVEFFAQPFMPNTSSRFQVWANAHAAEMWPLSANMRRVLAMRQGDGNRVLNAFKQAICGEGEVSGLLEADLKPIFEFLRQKPDMVAVLLHHKNDDIIEKWYAYEATDSIRCNRRRRSQSSQAMFLSYVSSMWKCKEYVYEQLMVEVDAIDDVHTLNDFSHALGLRPLKRFESWNAQNIIKQKVSIFSALIQQSEKDTPVEVKHKIDRLTEDNVKLAGALEKHRVLVDTVKIVHKHPKETRSYFDIVKATEKQVSANKEMLFKRRDTRFETLLKITGVVAASIVGCGIGGYFAYQRFFGSQGTTTGQMINDTSKIAKNMQRAVERRR